jgi:hypothetical protein
MKEKKKIIAINWRWNGFDSDKSSSELTVSNSYNIHIVCSAYEKSPDILLKKYIPFIKELIKDSESDVLVLTHNNNPNMISEEDLKKYFNPIPSNLKIFEFKGGNDDRIYITNKGFLNINISDISIFLNNTKSLPENRFLNVWNYYWSEVILEEQKKKLIDTFLPLAIDMQGLIDMPNSKKKDEYRKEIFKSLDEYGNKIIQSWDEIKKVLGLKTTNEDKQTNVFDFDTEDIKKLYFQPSEESEENILTNIQRIIELFKSSHGGASSEANIIKEWINHAVRIINEQIEKLNKKKSDNNQASEDNQTNKSNT